MSDLIPPWLAWAREIQSIAQTGRQYALNDFQSERYHRLAQIAAEMIAAQTGADPQTLAADFAAQVGYATPKVDVRAAVLDEHDRILMVKDWSDGTWSMPGGWADVGDIPSQAAARETLEEAGLSVKVVKLLGVYDANRTPDDLAIYHAYKLVYRCVVLGGELQTSAETPEVGFFDRDHIPAALSQRSTSRQIGHVFEHAANPNLPAFFD
jgi:ADP-ribose pyrophosphatase YjhB (NUDIX family)